MRNLLTQLIQDGEQIAAGELPELKDLPKLLTPLVIRLEAALPGLAEHELADLIAQHNAKQAAAEAPAGETTVPPNGETTSIQTAPAHPQPPVGDVKPSESAGTAAGGAPSESETRAERLRREADEAEFAEWQAQRAAADATAAGAHAGAVVSDGEQARPVQDSSK